MCSSKGAQWLVQACFLWINLLSQPSAPQDAWFPCEVTQGTIQGKKFLVHVSGTRVLSVCHPTKKNLLKQFRSSTKPKTLETERKLTEVDGCFKSAQRPTDVRAEANKHGFSAGRKDSGRLRAATELSNLCSVHGSAISQLHEVIATSGHVNTPPTNQRSSYEN